MIIIRKKCEHSLNIMVDIENNPDNMFGDNKHEDSKWIRLCLIL